jgi:phosphohistidine phosphatase
MTGLLLLRHAKAVPQGDEGSDSDRPLAEKGARQMRALAAWAAERRIRPALVLCSSAVRTRQTLALIAAKLKDPETLFEDEIYLAGARALLHRLRNVPATCASVMVVGHNPGLHELSMLLLRSGAGASARRLKDGMPTGALAMFELDGPWTSLDRGAARLVEFVTPKELGT